jgi:hypothetical protein
MEDCAEAAGDVEGEAARAVEEATEKSAEVDMGCRPEGWVKRKGVGRCIGTGIDIKG